MLQTAEERADQLARQVIVPLYDHQDAELTQYERGMVELFKRAFMLGVQWQCADEVERKELSLS